MYAFELEGDATFMLMDGNIGMDLAMKVPKAQGAFLRRLVGI